MITSPKARFAENKADFSEHHELVTKSSFLRALDAAMLEMVFNIDQAATVEAAYAQRYRIEGAQAFIRTLLNLTETPTPDLKKPVDYNLRWNVK